MNIRQCIIPAAVIGKHHQSSFVIAYLYEKTFRLAFPVCYIMAIALMTMDSFSPAIILVSLHVCVDGAPYSIFLLLFTLQFGMFDATRLSQLCIIQDLFIDSTCLFLQINWTLFAFSASEHTAQGQCFQVMGSSTMGKILRSINENYQ